MIEGEVIVMRCYSIHDIITFQILSGTIPKRMEIEYANFQTNLRNPPDFTLELGKFKPSNEDCQVIDHTYYIKKNYFYCKDSYKFGKWEIQITGLELDKTNVQLWTNSVGTFAADMFICMFFIDFLIRFKLERKGYSVIHASAMSKDNKGFLFPSQSGAGKTTTALYLSDEGYDYLGDDFVILHDGELYSYPSALNLFSYNLNPAIKKNLSMAENILLSVKNALYIITARKIKIFTKMNPKILPGLHVVDKATLKALYLLAQGDEFAVSEINPVPVTNSIAINQRMESYPFFKYLLEYSYIFPDSSIARHWEVCEKNLIENLKGAVKYYNVRLPKKYNKDIFQKFKEVIECMN